LRQWIEASLGRLYGYAFALTQDAEQARDLVQDCAVRALQARRCPDHEAAYRAWLFRILRNAFIDRCRRSGTEVQIDESHEQADHEEDGWVGDRRMVDAVTIRIAVAKLPVPHREIIALVDFVGYSYAEAAEVLDIAEGTVMSRLSRARKALLTIVAEDNITPLANVARTNGIRR
jgi:RNA polymerase sigma-70 factor (ECF subfamily)